MLSGHSLKGRLKQHTLEDIPKATRCEKLQDPISQHAVLRAPVCSGLGPRHYMSWFTLPLFLSVVLLRRKRGEGMC